MNCQNEEQPDIRENRAKRCDHKHVGVADLSDVADRRRAHTDRQDHQHVERCRADDRGRAELARVIVACDDLDDGKHDLRRGRPQRHECQVCNCRVPPFNEDAFLQARGRVDRGVPPAHRRDDRDGVHECVGHDPHAREGVEEQQHCGRKGGARGRSDSERAGRRDAGGLRKRVLTVDNPHGLRIRRVLDAGQTRVALGDIRQSQWIGHVRHAHLWRRAASAGPRTEWQRARRTSERTTHLRSARSERRDPEPSALRVGAVANLSRPKLQERHQRAAREGRGGSAAHSLWGCPRQDPRHPLLPHRLLPSHTRPWCAVALSQGATTWRILSVATVGPGRPNAATAGGRGGLRTPSVRPRRSW